MAFLINVCIISVSGAVCSSENLDLEDQRNCGDLDLNKASFLLKVCQTLSRNYSYNGTFMPSSSKLSFFTHCNNYLSRSTILFLVIFMYINLVTKPFFFLFFLLIECPGKLEFKVICGCIIGFRSELYNYRNLRRTICHAGFVLFFGFRSINLHD